MFLHGFPSPPQFGNIFFPLEAAIIRVVLIKRASGIRLGKAAELDAGMDRLFRGID